MADGVTLLVEPQGHFLAGEHGGREPNAEFSLVVRPAPGPELADGDLDVEKELRVLLPILDAEDLAMELADESLAERRTGLQQDQQGNEHRGGWSHGLSPDRALGRSLIG